MEKSWNCVFEFLWEPCLILYNHFMIMLLYNGEAGAGMNLLPHILILMQINNLEKRILQK